MIEPDIAARVTLYPTAAGGRMGPTPPDRFGCLLVIANESFDCRMLLDGVGSLAPGQTALVPIKFLDIEAVRALLRAGRTFDVWDGGIVGEGEIEEVLAS